MRPQYQALARKARRLRALAVTAFLRSAAQGLAGWLRASGGAAGKLIKEYAAERKRRNDIRALRQLDDRMLRDIGVFRGEIPHVVRYGQTECYPKLVAMPRRAPRAAPELKQAACPQR